MSEEMMKIAIFQKKEIRKQLHGGEWWFVMADVIVALTESTDPAQYLKRLKLRDEGLSEIMNTVPVEKGAVQIVPPFHCPSIPLAVSKNYPAGTLRASSVFFQGLSLER